MGTLHHKGQEKEEVLQIIVLNRAPLDNQRRGKVSVKPEERSK